MGLRNEKPHSSKDMDGHAFRAAGLFVIDGKCNTTTRGDKRPRG